MSWGVSVATVIGGGAALTSGSVALFAWRHRTKWVALPFMGLAVTLASWSLFYGIQLGYETLAEQLVWQRVTLGVSGFVPTMWLLFTLSYSGYDDWLTRNRMLLFVAEPAAFLLLCLTNPTHELVWTGAVMTETAVGFVPALEFGAGYAIHIIVAYAMVTAGIWILIIYGTTVAPIYKKQVLLLVTAAVPPFLSHISFTFGSSPVPALDLTPFVFAFSGVVFSLALFRFDLLKLAPLAPSQSLKEVGDGLVVLNTDGEIVDLLGIATDALEPTPHIGDPISTVFPDTTLAELDGFELTTVVDGQQRVYQFQRSTLTTHRDRQVGAILILRDITGLQEYKQRLSVSSRVLRHNLRNEMTVVLGFADQLESRLSGQNAEDARKIRETAENLLEMTEKARQITQLHAKMEDGTATIDAVEQIHSVLDELRSEYPTAEWSFEKTGEAVISVIDPETFRLAIRNVVDNAVRHNDAANPRVEITIEQTAEATLIEISDNGPGIPETEREAIDSGIETQLEHSQGLGLWLTHWFAAMNGGELGLGSASDGTTVTIRIPGNRSAMQAHRMREQTDV